MLRSSARRSCPRRNPLSLLWTEVSTLQSAREMSGGKGRGHRFASVSPYCGPQDWSPSCWIVMAFAF